MSSELVKNNKFLQVLLAARRAKQIINGSKKRVESKSDSSLTVAMEEISQGKIDFNDILHAPILIEPQPEAEESAPLSPEEVFSELMGGGEKEEDPAEPEGSGEES